MNSDVKCVQMACSVFRTGGFGTISWMHPKISLIHAPPQRAACTVSSRKTLRSPSPYAHQSQETKAACESRAPNATCSCGGRGLTRSGHSSVVRPPLCTPVVVSETPRHGLRACAKSDAPGAREPRTTLGDARCLRAAVARARTHVPTSNAHLRPSVLPVLLQGALAPHSGLLYSAFGVTTRP